MPTRKLQVFNRYRFGPRSVLVPGDRFRVSGGPVYVSDDGTRIPMYQRGVFVFRRFCVRGASRWIEAYQPNLGFAVLRVGRPGRSRVVPNLRRRPYKIIKVRG